MTIKTDSGDIAIKVEADLSPIAAGNFVALADCGWYDGVVFHRLVPGFVIQGGDGQYGRVPNVDRTGSGPADRGYTIADEPVKTPYGRGTVAMARTHAPNSVGSQFFIVLDDAAADALSSAQHLPDHRPRDRWHGRGRQDRRDAERGDEPGNAASRTSR